MKTQFNRHSLFWRLLLIFGLTFAGIFGAIGLGLRAARPERPNEFMRRNLQNYAQYLAQEIGTPPSRERARAVVEKTGLQVWIESPTLQWQSTPETPRRHSFDVRIGDTQYRFSGPWGLPRPESPKTGIAVVLALSLLVLGASYIAVRRTFQPIAWIKEATERYSTGDWSARVPTTGSAELVQLSRLINSMAEKIAGHFAAMRSLLAAVSHELRSPLARLRVGLESVENPEVRTSLIEEIHLLDRLTESILSSERTRLQSQKLQLLSVDLNTWLAEQLKPYGTQVLWIPAPQPLSHAIDPDQMALALRSILNNAITHGKSEQPVRVQLTPSTLVIEDFGAGMSAETLAHLGEPFFQGAASRPHDKIGFGFGLSAAKAILDAHGWRWSVHSERGRGTRFEIQTAQAKRA